MRARSLAVLAVLAVAGCGSDSSPSAAPPPSPIPDPNLTPTTALPEPQPQPQPQPDRFVDVERLDANAECDALVPTRIPAPVRITVPSQPTGCGGGVSDGTGHVAVAVQVNRGAEWHVFSPNGFAEQRFAITSDLWPQADGWLGVRASTTAIPATVDVLSFFADGSPRRSERPEPAGFSARSSIAAPDPIGGALVVLFGPTGTGDCIGEARRYDATGTPSAAGGRTGCLAFTAGVSNAGEALVLESPSGVGGPTVLRWLRPDGTPARETSQETDHSTGPLLPLLEGSLVALDGSRYARRYARLATASEPTPAWLAPRTSQSFRSTRGNRGYAFFAPADRLSPDCTQIVELVAPSGRPCARLTFRRDGNDCVTGAIDQGWDGTVVQQAARGACEWRFWPRLLAGD